MNALYSNTSSVLNSMPITVAPKDRCNQIAVRTARMNNIHRSGTTRSAVPALILVVALILFGLFIARDPIAEFQREKSLHQQNLLAEKQKRAQYELLSLTIRQDFTKTRKALRDLRASAQLLENEAEAAFGIPLRYACGRPDARPRILDQTILNNYAFARAYAQLANAQVSVKDLDYRRQNLAIIESHLKSKELSESHRDTLREITDYIQYKQKQINAARLYLDYLRDILRATQLETHQYPDRKEVQFHAPATTTSRVYQYFPVTDRPLANNQ